MQPIKEHLYMIGFMGVGKTSTSRALSRRLRIREIDTDALIVQREKMPISEIFASKGEEYFRKTETALLEELAQLSPCIVSCGGGMVLRQENIDIMKREGRIILLSATPETIYEHVKDSTNRPLLNGHMNVEYIGQLMQEREPRYRAAADLIIETDGLTPGEVAEKIINVL